MPDTQGRKSCLPILCSIRRACCSWVLLLLMFPGTCYRKGLAIFVQVLTISLLSAQCFSCPKSFESLHKFYGGELLLSPSHRWGNWLVKDHMAGKCVNGKGSRSSEPMYFTSGRTFLPQKRPQEKWRGVFRVAWQGWALPCSQSEPCSKAPENSFPGGNATNSFLKHLLSSHWKLSLGPPWGVEQTSLFLKLHLLL